MVEVDILGGVLGVFERHGWIEPGETIEESFAAPLPVRNDRAAVRLRLRIVSRHRIFKNIEWNATRSLNCVSRPVTIFSPPRRDQEPML